MSSWREFPERPIVGVGGVVIESERVLLILRGNEPLKGQWSIPGGTLELGETLVEGSLLELPEPTGTQFRVTALFEAFEKLHLVGGGPGPSSHRGQDVERGGKRPTW